MIYYANENAPYIQHYGVLGMRWGHRKSYKKEYGLSKHQLKKKIRKSEKKNRELINELAEKDLLNNKRFVTASERSTKIAKQINKYYEKNPDSYNLPKHLIKKYSEQKKYSKIADSESKKIGEKYSNKYKQALLKDIGYDNIEKGINMLKTYKINDDVYDPILRAQDKLGYLYEWNMN